MRTGRPIAFRLAAIAAGAGAFAVFQLLVAYPQVAENAYAGGLGRLVPSIMSRLTGAIPFSLAMPVIAGFVLWQVIGIARGLSRVRRGERGIREAIVAGLLRAGSDAGIAVFLFYVMWGFHYARPPIEQRLGWPSLDAGGADLDRLAGEMVDAANAEYRALHPEARETGYDALTPPPDRRALIDHLASGWIEVESIAGSGLAAGFGDPKPLLGSRVLDHLGLAGFYFPWTGEANYNRGTPPVSLPQVVAHEMAHQRGFAPEDEANFIGYLVAALSPHPYPRYSAAVFAQRQLIFEVARRDREKARALVERRLPGVQRDIDAERAYWERFEGPATQAAARVNDAYLKSQRVEGGIESYSRSVELLIIYAGSRGGTLTSPP